MRQREGARRERERLKEREGCGREGEGEREGGREETFLEVNGPKDNLTTFRGTVVKGQASTDATEKISEENPKLLRIFNSREIPPPTHTPPH